MADEVTEPAANGADQDGRPARRRAREVRRQWTITSAKITPEFRIAVRKAADRAGLAQAEWMVDRLQRAAIDELKRETLPGPTAEDTARMLAEIRTRLDEQKPDPRLDDIADGLRSLGAKLDDRTRGDARIGAMMEYLVEVRNEVRQARQEATESGRRRGVFARLFGRD